MEQSDLLLGSLGLCRKAGKLLGGYDRVEDAVAAGKARLVLMAADTSERTSAHLQAVCRGIVPCRTMPLSTQQLAALMPKKVAVYAVTDENFARLCAKHLTEIKEDIANGL
jgi:ribosomal protein L7Ae-like RNA K-turn-binding protein